MSKLPPSWEWSTIGELTAYIQRGKSPKYSERSDLPVVNQKCIRWNRLEQQHLKFIHPDQFSAWDTARYIRAGDVLWNSTGTGTVGRAYLVKDDDCNPPKVVDSHVTIVRYVPEIEPRYLFNWIRSPAVQDKIEEMCDGTTNQIELSRTAIAATAIPVAPAAEQTRIADQLDTLLARIQACQDRLNAIPALLKRFRQAVLDAALSGQVTEDWRKAELTSIDDWKAKTINDIALVGTGSTPLRSNGSFFSTSGTPWVTSAATSRAYVDSADEYVTPAAIAAHRLKVYTPGTLLVAMYGEGKTRGQVSELRMHAAINQACAAISVDRRQASVAFVKLALWAQYQQMSALAEGGNQPNLNLSKVKGIPVQLPPEREQAEIVRRVEALFKLADRIEASNAAALAQAQRLTPLTLAKAFRGELVQQDPQDESASALLQRIAKAPATVTKTLRGWPRNKKPNISTVLPAVQPDWGTLPAGAWTISTPADEHTVAAVLTAVLRAWGRPMPQDEARLAAVLCLQPRFFTPALPVDHAAQWRRLVGTEAEPLPAPVAALQPPAVNTYWRRALAGMRGRGDLVESGPAPHDTWALGPGAASVDTAGWPDGRAGWVVAYLQAHGVEAVLPSLVPEALEFVHARAA